MKVARVASIKATQTRVSSRPIANIRGALVKQPLTKKGISTPFSQIRAASTSAVSSRAKVPVASTLFAAKGVPLRSVASTQVLTVRTKSSQDQEKKRLNTSKGLHIEAKINNPNAPKDIFQTPYYHWSSFALAATTVHILAGPKFLNFPVDLAMSCMIPFHGYLGMKLVVNDYIPGQPLNNIFNILIAILALLTLLGLLKISFGGPGITESIRYLWKDKQEYEEKKKR